MTQPLCTKVFVYGTLKPGFSNHDVARQVTAPTQMTPATLDGHTIHCLGGFPAIQPGDAAQPVQGYLLSYSAGRFDEVLTRLDGLEGYRGKGARNMYDRQRLTVNTAQGPQDAWVYVWDRGELKSPAIPSGSWKG